jgi:23S rRNA pseudouridine1911/1915/1917 synthase
MSFQSLQVDQDAVGQRADAYLAARLDLSRNQVKHMIENGDIRINHKALKKAGVKIQAGDLIHYRIKEAEISQHQAEDIPLDVIYEDSDILVINKDPGIVVHPDESGHSSGTIVNAVLSHTSELSGIGGEKRPGIVHRLDLDTSGVLLIAKNDSTHQALSQAFHDRKVDKEYLALVFGEPKTKTGRIETGIKRDSKDRKRMAINAQGKKAITNFEVVESYKGLSLLRVSIETGRTHQIRLHLASIGHPVVADDTYGDKVKNKRFKTKYGLSRQFLHAHRIELLDYRFTAELKKDLQEVLDQLSS